LFKKRDFCFLTLADAVSVLGDQIGWVALLWFATVTTKDPETVGGLGLAFGLLGASVGLSFLPMIWMSSVWLTYLSMALSGFLFSGYPPLVRTAVQRLVPQAYQGRILGIRGSLIALGGCPSDRMSAVHWVRMFRHPV
jgi:membrane associated rhomboid family serine protease